MKKHRPTAVLVLAILHFIGGGLGVMGVLCTGGMLAAGGSQSMFGKPPAPPPGKQGPNFEEFQRFQEDVTKAAENPPGGKAYQVTSLGVDLLLSLMLLIGGIGLLNMQPWGRLLSLVYAFLSIVYHIVGLGYMLGVHIPA